MRAVDPVPIVIGMTGVPDTDSVGEGLRMVKSVVIDNSLLEMVTGRPGGSAVGVTVLWSSTVSMGTGTFVVRAVDPVPIVIGMTGVPDTDSVGEGLRMVKSVVIDSSLLEIVTGRSEGRAVWVATGSKIPTPPELSDSVTGEIMIGDVSVESTGGSGVTEMSVINVVSGRVSVTEIGTTGGMVAPDVRLSVSRVGRVTGISVMTGPVESESVIGIDITLGSEGSEVVLSSGVIVIGTLLMIVVSGSGMVVSTEVVSRGCAPSLLRSVVSLCGPGDAVSMTD